MLSSNEVKNLLYRLIEYMIDKDWNDPEMSHIYETVAEDYGEAAADNLDLEVWRNYKDGTPDVNGNINIERLRVRVNDIEYVINIRAIFEGRNK